jgi:hypothetical protein
MNILNKIALQKADSVIKKAYENKAKKDCEQGIYNPPNANQKFKQAYEKVYQQQEEKNVNRRKS